MEEHGNHMRQHMKQLEDERSAEKIMCIAKMQSIKGECYEFDHQYNCVLGCWRSAEERSGRFEVELWSEITLFHEAREYLGELQQHFGHVMQEDHGASLGIHELESVVNRERSQYQAGAAVFAQETQHEFAELRDRADRICQRMFNRFMKGVDFRWSHEVETE